MKRTTILTMLLIPLLAPPAALAEPAWGGSCLSCHDQLLTDRVFIVDEDATTNPDESGTGAVDRGPLPTFKVYAGKTRALHAEIAGLSADDTYALEIKRLRFPGVEENGYLDHAADCTWPDWGLSTGYYTKPVIRYRWGVDPAEFAFDLTANPEADADTYDLVFAVAGKLTDGGGLYYSEAHFYVKVLAAGDLDEDGDVDLADHGIFATCVSGPGNPVPPPGCGPAAFEAADLDDDNDVDLADYATLTAKIAGPPA